MGARNRVGIGFSYLPASLCSSATQFQNRFLESIPRSIAGAGLKIPTLLEVKYGGRLDGPWISSTFIQVWIYVISCCKPFWLNAEQRKLYMNSEY
jgi:hypothetical protein